MDNLLNALNNLKSILQSNASEKTESINVFGVAGLNHYETKHSRFLAWLLNPASPHGFKGKPLELLCKFLIDYENLVKDKNIKIKKNKTILLGKEFPDKIESDEEKELKKEFFDLLNGEVRVIPELPIETDEVNKNGKKLERYIDIFIEITSNNKKTAIVIENKVESTTHDNQLSAYDEWVSKKGYDKEVFILLSPQGEIPRNFGGNNQYNEKWCVLDYSKIIELIKLLLEDLKNSVVRYKNKLKILLEDYMETVTEDVLHENNDVMSVCKSIYFSKQTSQYNAGKCVQQYFNNVEEPINYCVNKILEIVDKKCQNCNIFIPQHERLAKAVIFYTAGMQKIFDDSKEIISCSYFRWYFGYDGPKFVCYLALPHPNAGWTNAQKTIISKFGKKETGNEIKLFTKTLINSDNVGKKFEDIKSDFAIAFNECLKQIDDFESKLKI